ncbi:MAG TPA: GIY-YIG nuclease family protein [Terriglobales bacterium]|nr:GIY-YIG nuclease family protein [Terriglobales bacterium]
MLSRKIVVQCTGYKIKLMQDSIPFIGRMKFVFKRPSRSKAVNFENHYDKLIVSEVLPRPYSGEPFCGYDKIDIGFSALETIVSAQRTDWRVALQNAKGVYLITDTNNGMRYIGAAYGDTGIWSRWMCYIGTGHGYNDELTRIIAKHTHEYARKFFKFSLLEYFTPKTDDNLVIAREVFWKKVLLSREYGYNKN